MQRYRNVEVVKLPPKSLEDWRAANSAKCERDNLMPSISPKMIYACLTGTHFTHALKLGIGGDRTLNNDGKTAIKYLNTVEYQEIVENGVMAVVYDENLWSDKEASITLMLGDNLNASVQVGEDEVQAFGRVDRVVLDEVSKATGDQPTISLRAVFERIEKEGFGKFGPKEWTHFIKFRLGISHKAAQIFLMCQQQCVGARVSVKSDEFERLSRLAQRCPLTKIAVLLNRYHEPMAKAGKATGSQPTGTDQAVAHFQGTTRMHAQSSNTKTIAELIEEPAHLLSFETFLIEMFTHYKVTTWARAQGSDVGPRIALFSDIGRAALRTGDALAKLRHTQVSLRCDMTQEQRDEAIRLSMKGVFANAEDSYRKTLQQTRAVEGELPDPVHPVAGAQPTKKDTAQDAFAVGLPGDEDDDPDKIDHAALTNAEVFRRLGIEGIGQKVKIRPGATSVQIEGSRPPTEATPLRPAITGTLLGLDLPYSEIEVKDADEKTTQVFRVHVDHLMRAGAQPTVEETVRELALCDADSATKELAIVDFDKIGESVMRNLGIYALDWLFTMSHAATLGTKTLMLSQEGELPYEFQVRATRYFKKGELIIAPWVSPKDFVDELLAKKTDKIVHSALRVSATICVRGLDKFGKDPKERQANKKDKKKSTGAQPTDDTGEQPPENEETFFAQSPLLQGRAAKHRYTAYTNMAPFWAIPRCGKSAPDANNMEAKTLVFDLPPLNDVLGEASAVAKRTKPTWRVLIDVMVNTKAVKDKEVLALPFEATSVDPAPSQRRSGA